MSYSIVFETRIVRLDDGSIIHFDLSGCNNDNSGRNRGDFTGKLYTAEEWEQEIRRWESAEGAADSLKIGGRWRSWADYGKHLRLMTKRADTFDKFIKERYFVGYAFDGITYIPESGKSIDYPWGPECDRICLDVLYGSIPGGYTRKSHEIRTQDEVRNALAKKQPVEFYIGRAWRKSA